MRKLKITKQQALVLKEFDEKSKKRVLIMKKDQFKRVFENFNVKEITMSKPEMSDLVIVNLEGKIVLVNKNDKVIEASLGSAASVSNNKELCAKAVDAYNTLFENGRVSENLYKGGGDVIGPLSACKVGVDEEFESPISQVYLSGSDKLSREWKKQTKGIEPKIKGLEEEDLLGHPIGGRGGDEYIPQSEKENEKTFKHFNGQTIKEDVSPEIWNEVLAVINKIYTNPSQEGLSTFWQRLGVTWGEMISALTAAGLLMVGVTGAYELKRVTPNPKEMVKRVGRTLFGIKKKQQPAKNTFKPRPPAERHSKPELYKKNKFKETEKFTQMGDDIEMINDIDYVDYGNPAYDKEKEISEPSVVTPSNGYKVVHMNTEIAILEKDNQAWVTYIYDLDKEHLGSHGYLAGEKTFIGKDEDGMPDYDIDYDAFDIDADVIERYVNDNISKFKMGSGLHDYEAGYDLVLIDKELKNDLVSTYSKDIELAKLLGPVEETTGAASSGSFVAPMGSGPIKREMPSSNVADEMGKHVMGEYEEVGDEVVDINADIKGTQFGNDELGFYKVIGIQNKDTSNEGAIRYMIGLSENGQLSDSHLLFYYNPEKEKESLFLNYKYERLIDVYKVFDKVYHQGFDKLKETLKTTFSVEEQGIGGGSANPSGSYVQPKIWAKDEKNWRNSKEQNKMYPDGEIVDNPMVHEGEGGDPYDIDVSFDDCTKLNNNKEAQEGGCSVGAVDNVVKLGETKTLPKN